MVDIWRPLLAESLVEVPLHCRPFTADHVLFLYLWNYLQESIKEMPQGNSTTWHAGQVWIPWLCDCYTQDDFVDSCWPLPRWAI